MRPLILGFMFLSLASVAAAQAQTDWQTLVTKSGAKVVAVEGATEIDIGTAKALYDRGVKFVDVRGKRSWKRGHIPGARNFFAQIEATLMEIADKNEEVVFYCDCAGSPSCNLSPNASARAVSWGYQNVYYLTDASAWAQAGYPVEKAE